MSEDEKRSVGLEKGYDGDQLYKELDPTHLSTCFRIGYITRVLVDVIKRADAEVEAFAVNKWYYYSVVAAGLAAIIAFKLDFDPAGYLFILAALGILEMVTNKSKKNKNEVLSIRDAKINELVRLIEKDAGTFRGRIWNLEHHEE